LRRSGKLDDGIEWSKILGADAPTAKLLIHTKDFMEHLSERLNELPIPALSLDLPTKGGIQ
jgi:hypothetical protein